MKLIKGCPYTAIKYCPTDDNPADLLTRGLSYEALRQSTLWKHGPSWLSNGDWPVCEAIDSAIFECQLESIAEPMQCTSSLYAGSQNQSNHDASIAHIMDASRFSSLDKLLRVTCHVIRFTQWVRNRNTKTAPLITVTELENAQNIWIKALQQEIYHRELDILKSNKQVKSSLVHQLKLFLDDNGIMRCAGRLHNADLTYDAKHPVLLPPQHHYTTLLVRKAHEKLHAGVEATITIIRRNVWIPRLRRLVKTFIHKCVTCLKVQGKSYKVLITPPLPRFRLHEAPPFTVTGVDFTGTLHYKTTAAQVSKAYICLFTCAVTRAIHLELVTDMTTDSFLRAFRRFVGRCSLPRHMVSDNGSTFVAGAEEIDKLCRDSNVNSYLTSFNVQWSFIPKRAPWFGGVL